MVVTEAIVGAAGKLIGAPVCETAIVEIPRELTGWEFRPGLRLEPGFAHASRMVNDAVEARDLLYRDRDENRRHHAGVFALYDWCYGSDDQWLYSRSAEDQLFSHDHGWYLPEPGPTWSEASLVARAGQPRPLQRPSNGLDRAELGRLSHKLRGLEASQLVEALCAIPSQWPVTDGELECVGWFLQSRAKDVADRLSTYQGTSI